jgi:hypothetical protein
MQQRPFSRILQISGEGEKVRPESKRWSSSRKRLDGSFDSYSADAQSVYHTVIVITVQAGFDIMEETYSWANQQARVQMHTNSCRYADYAHNSRN